jgi:hypothetical protein
VARVLFLNFFAPIKLHYARERRKVALIRRRSSFSGHHAASVPIVARPFVSRFSLLSSQFLISSETLKREQETTPIELGCFPEDPRALWEKTISHTAE